jgi:hypothetical protein
MVNQIYTTGHMPVVHAYNLSYSGCRDQEDCVVSQFRPKKIKKKRDPISKVLNTKKGW